METIFAVSSGAPPAAIAVLRISGPGAFAAMQALAGVLPPPRVATLRKLRGADGDLLDHALLLTFPGPASATGEDVAELHLHGGRAVVAAVERALDDRAGLRRAEPGEFTRRALMAGRIDLTEAEGLGDLLTAETETQRRAAMTAAEGGVRRRIETWSARLLGLAARVEAQLDFADEDDVEPEEAAHIAGAARALAEDIAVIVAAPPVERLRDGIRVVLAGPPNSGKSTLINALVDRDVAIVSPIAGTTRDRIEVPVSHEGVAYLLTDTAGLAGATSDPIEAIGIERAEAAMATADIVLWLGDELPTVANGLWIHARADRLGRETLPEGRMIAVSAATGAGIPELWQLIEARALSLLPRLDDVVLNRRQRSLAGECGALLKEASQASDLLIVAEHFRLGLAALDRITGHSDTEAMLDNLFRKFCIGK
ncbi:tRNA uridine-5-carboxymethylaminomethyl(34) synthesis GTPase MnmE [Sphingomonas sp. ERG5]|uniref:tRNA uridine-5-carboxymethylaminomethyl(34) synthesis GTPase MnmE n=1 Tax=Sphingomonas sp. ERG5 TaxID=1381597 RepID=UPI00054B138E|nr:tRNA uridine-5-carboxymethylaminomethyl(34) synthesis GTPase MnmE [Sphingomonas sp. ERG5]